MKDTLRTAAVIAAIAVAIVLAIMAPKGFELGEGDPTITPAEMQNTASQ